MLKTPEELQKELCDIHDKLNKAGLEAIECAESERDAEEIDEEFHNAHVEAEIEFIKLIQREFAEEADIAIQLVFAKGVSTETYKKLNEARDNIRKLKPEEPCQSKS